jgi:hypothetical protein
MSLSDLASLGSFVSGLAVLASLVFLYFQIKQLSAQAKQSEKNQQAAIRQARITRIFDWYMGLKDAAVADVWRRGLEGDDALSETELAQFTSIMSALFLHAEDSFYQHEAGLLNEAAFLTFSKGLGGTLQLPGARAAWKFLNGNFNPGLAEYVDRLLATRSTPWGYLLSSARWKSDVARERAIATESFGDAQFISSARPEID